MSRLYRSVFFHLCILFNICVTHTNTKTYRCRSTTAMRVHSGVLWMMFLLVNLWWWAKENSEQQVSLITENILDCIYITFDLSKLLLAAVKNGIIVMVSKAGKENVHEAGPNTTNPGCNSAVMYAALTAPCIFFGFSLLSAGPLDSSERIPGSRTPVVLYSFCLFAV